MRFTRKAINNYLIGLDLGRYCAACVLIGLSGLHQKRISALLYVYAWLEGALLLFWRIDDRRPTDVNSIGKTFQICAETQRYIDLAYQVHQHIDRRRSFTDFVKKLILNDQFELLMNRIHKLNQLFIVNINLRISQMYISTAHTLSRCSEMLEFINLFLKLSI